MSGRGEVVKTHSDAIGLIENSFPLRFLRLLSPLAILTAAWAFFQDIDLARFSRDTAAWGIVTTQAPGNSGKIQALEYLNGHRPLAIPNPRRWGVPLGPAGAEEGPPPEAWDLVSNYGPWKTRTSLHGIDISQQPGLPPPDLVGVHLQLADLYRARFIGADLRGANFTGASLIGAQLTLAGLYFTDLTGADLREANFTNADLWRGNVRGADFSGANLTGADLRGVDLSAARNLTPAQVAVACIDAETTLPEGFSAPAPCQRSAASDNNFVVRGEDHAPIRENVPAPTTPAR